MNPEATDFRDSRWLRFVRFYTFNFPIDKGKGRVFKLAKKFCRAFPKNAKVTTHDGRIMQVSLRDWGEDLIYFLGTYESLCTSAISRYIRKGDVCVDVGANIGWFTTLFQTLCGETGEVHSFEPAPRAFQELQRNVALNKNSSRVFINNFGLGDKECNAELYLSPDLPDGHATVVGRPDPNSVSYPIKIRTLDSYLDEKKIDQVDVMKVDIEGAELMFLNGAKKLFEQKRPPVILMEMSPETAAVSGHSPNDLIDFLLCHGEYGFFALDENAQTLSPLKEFKSGEPGANVLCVPKAVMFDAKV